MPLKAIMDAADYYCEKENLFILEEDQKIRLVSRVDNRNRVLVFYLFIWGFTSLSTLYRSYHNR